MPPVVVHVGVDSMRQEKAIIIASFCFGYMKMNALHL